MDIEQALATWISSQRSEHTRRAYGRAVASLRLYTANSLTEITPADAEQFTAYLRERLSEASVNATLAACSAFYEYLLTRYVDQDGVGLVRRNPFSAVERARVQRFGKSRALTLDQARALLAQPDRSTVIGARDYALILAAMLTARRAGEIVGLRWGDIATGASYHWSGKGGVSRTDEMPEPVWAAIVCYLQQSGRWGRMRDDDPVFVAQDREGRDQPLSTNWLNETVQRYARAAGLPEWVHTHTLRHTAAQLRYHAGLDVFQISILLGHSDVKTTQIYLSTLGQADTSWQSVWDDLSTPRPVRDLVPTA